MWRCEKVIRPSSISPISVLSLRPKIIYYLARVLSKMSKPKMVHIELTHFLESNTFKVGVIFTNEDFSKRSKERDAGQ
jgi:hypothetical protein